jgi:hypothetical protein
MDHVKVLKRAWEIVWQYRALWIFGIILALTTAQGTPYQRGSGNGGGPAEYQIDEGDLPFPGDEFDLPGIPLEPEILPQIVGALIAIGVGLACMIVFLIIATTVARYVAETALIRMVDDYEETGEKHSVRKGFRLGWSRTALRLFLIDLLIGLPLTVVFILLFLLAFAPLLLWITQSTAAGVTGTVATIGLFLLVIFLAIVVSTVVSLLKPFLRRACALEEAGVIESIRQGLNVVRRHLKDVVVMWLIMIGLRIGWVIAMIAALILLFPFIILLIIVGGVLGGVPALLVGGLASLVFEGAVPWILGALVGLPIFILVMAVPWLFLGGLMEVYKSNVWTLTYRELRALESVEPELDQLPEPDLPDLE